MTPDQIEKKIREAFELNYEMLQLEGGHAITPAGKERALNQVLYYWRKLREVAEKVTETEVKLSLPEQCTPVGRRFSIEGIVDIVREEGDTWMYDIKTHDPDYINANKNLYEQQLNVYAYIWQELRGQPLNHCAVIATTFPDGLNKAIQARDPLRITAEMARWEPLIEIDFKKERVQRTIDEFAAVVDQIENSEFAPRAVEDLKKRPPGDTQLFATRVCRNCDARFSCSSWRHYAGAARAKSATGYRKYFEDLGDDVDVEEWKTVNLENSNIPDSIDFSD